jgi:hypothetical protein
MNNETTTWHSRANGADRPPVAPGDLVLGFVHPDDVLSDRRLTDEAKRTILANWASDAHAVENLPALRQLESGAIVRLDDILRALAALDAASGDGAIQPGEKAVRAPFARRSRRGTIWKRTVWPRDDDDDPPPSPVAAAARPARWRKTSCRLAVALAV